ncbi:MAG: hypothetical protein V3U27_16930, partial [Candidatus Tectomicrobia bacterium]
MAKGVSARDAIDQLRERREHDPKLLATLWGFQSHDHSEVVKTVQVKELRTFMILDEDVRTKQGNLIVSKGREVNVALIERLKNFE